MAKILPLESKKFKQKITKLKMLRFKTKKCVMYDCIRKSLRLCRWFGFFPVEGLEFTSISSLRYNIRSIYGIFTILTFMGLITMTCITLYEFANNELSIPLFSNFIFYTSVLISSILTLRLAKHLPVLMKEISDIENSLFGLDENISLKTNGLSYTVLFLGFIDHSLCILYAFKFVMSCLRDYSFSYPVWQEYFTLKLSHLPENRLGNFLLGMFLEITNTQATFMWVFIDVVVMSSSLYLVTYLKKFNKLVQYHTSNKTADWKWLRIKFSNLVGLVNKIDSHISLFVLQSFFSCLFFTCLQLYNTIRNTESSYAHCDLKGAQEALNSYEHAIYYSYSFMFLVMRTFVVSVMAADVKFWASEPVAALAEVQTTTYDIEIQRFYRQLTYTTIGLSGVFFYVTREMILTVLGNIVTYELMMIQVKYRRRNDTSSML